MQSHSYDFDWRDIVRILGPPLLLLLVFAAIIHGTAALNVLPAPRPTLDTDRSIIIHQADASRAVSNAEIVIAGDSSALIDAQARDLGQPAINLATLSFLSLDDHAQRVERYARANPGLKAVVILMHPEALRRLPGGTYHSRFLNAYLNREDFIQTIGVRDKVLAVLGTEMFRGRFLARALPTPLEGAYGRRFGFSDDLEKFMAQSDGSCIDPAWPHFEGAPEYRLAAYLKTSSERFRKGLPQGVKLFAAITPVPAGHVKESYAEDRARMLAQWSEWLQADALDGLPATMPDQLFVSTTHLNEQGAREYTAQLAKALRER